jgi:DNA-binding GntR family transcriptional regulator
MDLSGTGGESQKYAMSHVIWQASSPAASSGGTLVGKVYEILWKQIVEGERRQGERLIDAELVEELGVSRTPIRHALYQLQEAGLVETSTRRGFHVVVFNADDIRELYELRTILETAAIRAAASSVPEADLRAALEEIEVLRHVPDPEVGPRFLRADVQFHHELIAGNAGNRRLAEAIASQRAQMSLFLVGGVRMPGGIPTAIDEHDQILRSLLDRNVEGAATAMERHIQRVKEDVLRQLELERPGRVHRLRPMTT